MFAVENRLIGVALNFDGVRVGELRRALKNLDAVALQLRANDFRFAGDDAAHAEGKILDGNVVFAAIDCRRRRFDGVAGQLKNGFAHALAGDRAGVHADAADHERAVHDRNALAEFRGADGAFLAGGTAADYDQVEIEVSHAFTRYIDGFYLKLKLRAGGTVDDLMPQNRLPHGNRLRLQLLPHGRGKGVRLQDDCAAIHLQE